MEEMKTARNKEEFEELLKEGKAFHFEPESTILIADLGDDAAPIVKVQGKADEDRTLSLLCYAIGRTALKSLEKGTDPEEVIGDTVGACLAVIDSVKAAVDGAEGRKSTEKLIDMIKEGMKENAESKH